MCGVTCGATCGATCGGRVACGVWRVAPRDAIYVTPTYGTDLPATNVLAGMHVS